MSDFTSYYLVEAQLRKKGHGEDIHIYLDILKRTFQLFPKMNTGSTRQRLIRIFKQMGRCDLHTVLDYLLGLWIPVMMQKPLVHNQ